MELQVPIVLRLTIRLMLQHPNFLSWSDATCYSSRNINSRWVDKVEWMQHCEQFTGVLADKNELGRSSASEDVLLGPNGYNQVRL